MMHSVLNNSALWVAAPVLAFMVFAPIRHVRAGSEPRMRQAAVAGTFYPADPAQLAAMIDQLLEQVKEAPTPEPILAAVAPHAGYPYSGPVAAYTYAALKGRGYKRVVIVAPSHYDPFQFTSIYDGDAYRTPLGDVPVDKAFAAELAKMDSSMRLSGHGHDPTPEGGEHAIEVQLPWLQKVLGPVSIVPIDMGDQSYEASRALGIALEKLIKKEKHPEETLVLASSDLSHYHTWEQANAIDHKTLAALASWDYFSMSRNFQARIWEACGGAPIVAAMIYAERMGATQARVLRYANSGDITGDKSRVVGYSADLFVKADAGAAAEPAFSLNDDEKAELLALARKSVEQAVRQGESYIPEPSKFDRLNQERGAFVTLTIHGNLRGCIGYTAPIKPLFITVRDVATYAALRDPRFSAVTKEELPLIEYEISVLSPLRRVTSIEQIQVGTHGLLMKNGDSEGLLLPQVPVEQHWDRAMFLEQTCRKAGMSANCWRDENTDIFSFTAVVFNEHKS